MSLLIRAIAALANNKGGFIFLGVDNAGCQVSGLPDDTFDNTDIVRISDKMKNFLVPTPDFVKDTIQIGGMNVGVLYVEKYGVPPVVVCRDSDGLEDGNILFRYPGQSAKIKFGDLHAMLRERDLASQSVLLKSAQRLADIGTDRSLIVDTNAATMEASDMKLTIDRTLADQLEFIRQGEFEEVEGAPTLRLVGDVRAVNADGEALDRIEGRALTADGVLQAFLVKAQARTPLDYVNVSAQVQRQWLPLFYFLSQAGVTKAQAIEALEGTVAVYASSKANALERLRGQRSAFSAAGGQSATILAKMIDGDFAGILEDEDDRAIARAIQALPNGFENFEPVHAILLNLFDSAGTDSALKGGIFKASARLDELMFFSLTVDELCAARII